MWRSPIFIMGPTKEKKTRKSLSKQHEHSNLMVWCHLSLSATLVSIVQRVQR